MQQGWIRLHRQICERPDWCAEPFNRQLAWIDLLLLANHKPSQIYIRGSKVDVPRGCVCRSKEALAQRWSWSRGKVLRFLSSLETRQQIVQQKHPTIALIEVINYDQYQTDGTTDDTTDGTTDGQQKDNRRYTYKNDKNDKNEKKPSTRPRSKSKSLVPIEPDVVSKEDAGFREFAQVASEVLGCKKMPNASGAKKYKTRLKSFTHTELLQAIRNVPNEKDQWKLRNVAHKPLTWWLKSDDYIEELLQLHKKGRSPATIIP